MTDPARGAGAAGAVLRGLAISLDGLRLRHVCHVGERPHGRAVRELGALRAEPADGRTPVWLAEGRLLHGDADGVPPPPGARALLRWIAAPLAWGAAVSRPGRMRLVVSRGRVAALRAWRRRPPDQPRWGPPVGYLHQSAPAGTLPLYAAVHQVTGDQLLTTVPTEAAELGYGAPVLLGHLVAAAPLTGVLVRRTGLTPSWASRLGLRTELELAAIGAITQPGDGSEVAGDAFRVAGWAVLAGEGVARVELLVDGRKAGRARLGLPRPAPQRLWRSPEGFVSGFDFWVGQEALAGSGPEIHVEALATGLRGTELVLAPRRPVTLRAPSPAASESHRESVWNPAPAGGLNAERRAGSGGLRLLAFTHRLDAGGAQRYFAEQLRRLVEKGDASAVAVAPADGEWRARLEDAGIEVRVTSGYPTGSKEEYEESIGDLASSLAGERFDAAFVNTLDSFPGADLADRMGLPNVWAIHESFELPVWWAMVSRERFEPYPQARLQHALGRAHALLFAADATKALYRTRAPDERMLLAPYGLETSDIDDFRHGCDTASLRRRLGVPEDAMVVLCLSVIEPRKGQAVLARAFAEVCARHPDAHLVLVGDTDSPYSSGLHRYVHSSHIADRCTIVPLTMDAYPWHAIADVFVLASDVESSPIAILEAMAFDTPVVAPRVFGIPELITDGRDGYLFEASDVADLARALDRVLGADAAERRAVGLAGSTRVRGRHDPKRYAANLERLLRRVVDAPSAPPDWDSVSPGGARPSPPSRVPEAST